MSAKQKLAKRKDTKKPAAFEKSQRNQVDIVKHFQPNVTYNLLHRNCDLPEINSDVDIIHSLNTIRKTELVRRNMQSNTAVNRAKVPQKTTINVPNSKDNQKAKETVTKENARFSIKPNSKTTHNFTSSSSSSFKRFESKNLKQPKTQRSKSFVVNNQNIDKKLVRTKNAKSKFASVSSSEVSETHVDLLKKEIISNRTANSASIIQGDIKINNKNRQERVQNLRNEIKKLIENNTSDKITHIAELKTEIAAYRNDSTVHVYNLNKTKFDDDNIKLIEYTSDENNTELSVPGKELKSCSQHLSLPYKDVLEVVEIPTGSRPESPVDIPPTVERLPDQHAGLKLCCRTDSESEEIIKLKIRNANLLIQRVSKTLKEISGAKIMWTENNFDALNFEKTGSDSDKETINSPQEIDNEQKEAVTDKTIITASEASDIVSEEKNDSLINLNDENITDVTLIRPKTRRCSPMEQDSEVDDKFRTVPNDNDEAIREHLESMAEFEILQAKLNTITEQTESDVSIPEEKDIAVETKVSTTSASCNTEFTFSDFKEAHIERDFATIGTQSIYSLTAAKEATTQTSKSFDLVAENNHIIEITPKELKKTCHLMVQMLPPINIRSDLVHQKIISLSIDSLGVTHVHYQNSADNVCFLEMCSESMSPTGSFAHMESLKKQDEDLISILTDAYLQEFHVKKQQENIHGASQDMAEISNINFLDYSPQCTIEYTAPKTQSVAETDTQILFNKNNSTKKSSELLICTSENLEREAVLQSYHIYEYSGSHDPGELSTRSLDLLSNIDENIYKTFINPEGLHLLPKQSNDKLKVKDPAQIKLKKMATLEKLSAMKFGPAGKIQNADLDTSTSERKRSPEIKPKLWNIGLYDSKATQYTPAEEITDVPEMQCAAEVIHDKDTSANLVTFDNLSDERISLTISYSSEETVSTETSSLMLANQKNTISPEQQNDRVSIEEWPVSESFSSSKRRKSTIEFSTFKQIKNKITKEHPAETKQKESQVAIKHQKNNDHISGSAVPDFISGLMSTRAEDIRRVLPKIQRSVRGLTSSNHNYASSDKFDKMNKNRSTLMPVHIHGDYIQKINRRKNVHLELGENGRYKNEENMFYTGNIPKYEDISLRRRRFRYLPKNRYTKKYNLDSSFSDTVTTSERSISEGEIKCQCSASIGELHNCKCKNRHSVPIKPKFSKKEPLIAIRKRRTYFNNWITYYLNKNAIPVNDSSSTSSSK